MKYSEVPDSIETFKGSEGTGVEDSEQPTISDQDRKIVMPLYIEPADIYQNYDYEVDEESNSSEVSEGDV